MEMISITPAIHQTAMTRSQMARMVLILGVLNAFSAMSIDMYLPAFPMMAEDLGVPLGTVQLSISAFLFGSAAGQLFYGPLSDRWGRRKPLLCGLALYIASAIGCACVRTGEGLLFWRVVMAIGGGAGMVISRAVVRDLYDTTEAARMFSLLMLVMGAAPILAPIAGGTAPAADRMARHLRLSGSLRAAILCCGGSRSPRVVLAGTTHPAQFFRDGRYIRAPSPQPPLYPLCHSSGMRCRSQLCLHFGGAILLHRIAWHFPAAVRFLFRRQCLRSDWSVTGQPQTPAALHPATDSESGVHGQCNSIPFADGLVDDRRRRFSPAARSHLCLSEHDRAALSKRDRTCPGPL